MNRVGRWVVLLGVGAMPALAVAQTSPPIFAGSKIRIRTLVELGFLGARVEGRVERISGDTVIVAPKDGSASQPMLLDRETQLDVSMGRRTSVTRGALFGGVGGVVSGGLFSALAKRSCSETTPEPLCSVHRSLSGLHMVLFTGVGVVVGGALGAVAHHEVWRRSRILPRVRPGVISLGPREVAVVLGVRF